MDRASKRPWYKKISFSQILLYSVLILYGLVSIFPFFYMLSTSMMTLGEATTGRVLPRGISAGSDISPCILYTTDTFLNDDAETDTRTRVIVSVKEEAAS